MSMMSKLLGFDAKNDDISYLQKAFQLASEQKNNIEFISGCISSLRGDIVELSWDKHQAVVTEQVTIKFPDANKLKISRTITDSSLKVRIKRAD